MEYQEWKKKKERSDNAWTGIIILAFICFWPAGIALVVLKNAGKLPILGTGQTLQQWRQTLAHLAQQQPAAAPPPASPKQQDRAKRKLKFGGALLGTGVTLAVLGLLQIVIAVGAALVPLLWMLRGTRLQTDDLRITVPAPWSPAFCLPVFLGVASTANLCGGLLVRLAGAEDAATLLPSGGAELFVQFLALCAVPAGVEELLFRGALQGLMRPSGSAAAIFGPALLFGLLHLDLAQGLTAFACGVFLGWLAERSGSILPGMLLHFCNNTLAFLNLYLRFYAPQPVSFGVELFILFFFPVFGVWLIWHARQQGFRFSAGLRPGVDVTEIFTSPVYDLAVVFLVCYTIFV